MSNYFNKIKISFSLAWNSLRSNLMRTSLTVLGMVIGVAAIVTVYAAGEGIKGLVTSEVESYGSNIIQTEIRDPRTGAHFSSGDVTTLKIADLEAINQLSNVSQGYAASLGQAKVSVDNNSEVSLIMGVSASYVEVDSKIKITEGDFFSEADDKNWQQVVVLGYQLKTDLFADSTALGRYVNLAGSKYKVIGVLAEFGGNLGIAGFDDMVYMPIRTLHKRILGIDHAMYFSHQIIDIDLADDTAEEIRFLLRERHKISDPSKDDFRVTTMAEMLETAASVTQVITLLLLAIVLISLLVGGVGIMNIMYVTVTERTPEIGLRKAIGASEQDISLQFLIEAVLITFWGWLLGLVLGIGLAFILSLIAKSIGLEWQFILPFKGMLVSFLFSLGSGFIFGFRPAKQAAQLDPITALSQE